MLTDSTLIEKETSQYSHDKLPKEFDDTVADGSENSAELAPASVVVKDTHTDAFQRYLIGISKYKLLTRDEEREL
ncbi:MAG: sigma-70 factor domain-containing protein, partial [Desulfobacterales bacterium]